MRHDERLVALEVARKLTADLVRRIEVQRIVGGERLHDMVVGAAVGFVELLLHRLELVERGLRHAVDAGDQPLVGFLPVLDVVDDALQTSRDCNEFNACKTL